jgi:predicted nuclease of restriction endonuclease-like RecB superfamily
MLTADLAQSWQRGDRVTPRYVARDDAGYLHDAAELVRLCAAHEGKERQELDAALEEYVGTGTDYRTLRGFIKLLLDRCEFATDSRIDPVELRRALFRKAAAQHPVPAEGDARAELILEVARELGCTPDEVVRGLYADLPERQRLTAFETLTESALLDLYNLAQAQALLYRCVALRLWIEPQGTEGYRELFGAIKAYRLIHTIKGNAEAGYEVLVNGPFSLFQRSQKYGVQMAVFLPALLLCARWRMRAEIVLKEGGTAFFELTSEQRRLRTHYLPRSLYETRPADQLAEAWANYDSPWTLEASSEVLDLGESAFIPDFVLRHADGHVVFIEVLGFWTPAHLATRLAEFAHGRVRNFLLAAWDDLRGSREPLAPVPANVLVFKRRLDPAAVEHAVNALVADEAHARDSVSAPC